MTDLDLLRRYATDASPESFEALVRAHAGWVYAAALRQVRDPALAEDLTQQVFVLLAQRAPDLARRATPPSASGSPDASLLDRPATLLTGWLFRTLRFAALAARRKEGRRRKHEARAAIAADTIAADSAGPVDSAWERLAPHLDQAVAHLAPADRQAVLLRFYQGHSFAQIAQTLGTTEPTARQRVSRAVKRLAKFLKSRGVTLSAALITAALLGGRAGAAALPAALAGSLARLAGGAAVAAPAAGQIVRVTLHSLRAARRRLAAAVAAAMLALGVYLAVLAWPTSPPDPALTSLGRLPPSIPADMAPTDLGVVAQEFPRHDPVRGVVRAGWDVTESAHRMPGRGTQGRSVPAPRMGPGTDAGPDVALAEAYAYLRALLTRPDPASPARAAAEAAPGDGPGREVVHSLLDWFLGPVQPESHGQFADSARPAGGGGAAPHASPAAVAQPAQTAAAAAADLTSGVVSFHGSATLAMSDADALAYTPAPAGVLTLVGTPPTRSHASWPTIRGTSERLYLGRLGASDTMITFRASSAIDTRDRAVVINQFARPASAQTGPDALIVRLRDMTDPDAALIPFALLLVPDAVLSPAEAVYAAAVRSSRAAFDSGIAVMQLLQQSLRAELVLDVDHSWLVVPESWLERGLDPRHLSVADLDRLLDPFEAAIPSLDPATLPVGILSPTGSVDWQSVEGGASPAPAPEPAALTLLPVASLLLLVRRRVRRG